MKTVVNRIVETFNLYDLDEPAIDDSKLNNFYLYAAVHPDYSYLLDIVDALIDELEYQSEKCSLSEEILDDFKKEIRQ